MGSQLSENAAPVFAKLGPRMSLFTPPEPASGELVILCTWLGAAKKHIAKYTVAYRDLAPNAKILLIESSVSILTSTYPVQWKAIRPAAQVVRAVLEECRYADTHGANTNKFRKDPRIVLHTFSNGGTNSATQLLIELNKERSGASLPIFGIICDSGPAVGTYWKSYNSMLLSLPRGLMWRIIGPVVIQFVLVVLFSSVAIGRYEQPEAIIRRTLLDDKYIKSRRVSYMLSRADKMVAAEDIHSHANDARAKGWHVSEIIFDDTAHCNHISKYSRRYFDAVKDMWQGKTLDSSVPSKL